MVVIGLLSGVGGRAWEDGRAWSGRALSGRAWSGRAMKGFGQWWPVGTVGAVWRVGIGSAAVGNGGSGEQTKPLHCSGYLFVYYIMGILNERGGRGGGSPGFKSWKMS